MNKLLAVAGALTLASCVSGSPAYALENNHHQSYERNHQGYNNHRTNRDWNRNNRVWHDPRYYDRSWDRRYRGSSYWHWRYFYRYPSYYEGVYCPRYSYVIVEDPYTGRLVCMPRNEYDRYRIELRINL